MIFSVGVSAFWGVTSGTPTFSGVVSPNQTLEQILGEGGESQWYTGTGTQDAGSALRARPVATNKLYGGVIYIKHNVIVARTTVALRDTIELFRLCEKFLLVPLQASLTCLGSP